MKRSGNIRKTTFGLNDLSEPESQWIQVQRTLATKAWDDMVTLTHSHVVMSD